jgi:imidazoleglycerol phosphate synthase glutamine amidotransferase subunit HisH
MTILIADRSGTDVYRFEEDDLFVAHPRHDWKVVQYIDRMCQTLEEENDIAYFVHSINCDIDLIDLEDRQR